MKLTKILQDSLNEAKEIKADVPPSKGLSKSKKSEIVKKAKAGKDIGRKGKGFEAIAKKAGGGEKGRKIAASVMWKNIKREGINDGQVDDEGSMIKSQLMAIAKYATKMHDMLDDNTQLDGWVQSHIAKAEQLMDQVGHFMEGQEGGEI